MSREQRAYWLRIDNPDEFTVGVMIREDRVVQVGSPTFERFLGMTKDEIRDLAKESGWTIEEVD